MRDEINQSFGDYILLLQNTIQSGLNIYNGLRSLRIEELISVILKMVSE